MPPHDQFRYDSVDVDTASGSVSLRYSTSAHAFIERYDFGPGGNWDDPAVAAAVRILFLLAGVSYYKTTAAPLIDLGELPSTAEERAFLTRYYVEGLGEFAYCNGLDLRDVRVVGPDAAPGAGTAKAVYDPAPGRPLIPFGGGIDSLVTVAALAVGHPDASLFVVHPPGDRFAAIEDAAAVTGLPIVHVAREIDPLVRRSDELGFLNGHVPVTAIITAAAVVAATLDGRDAVVLSNEWSASVPTRVVDGVAINHQWSKGDEFEQAFQGLVEGAVGRLSVFSYLRPRTELWVAEQFARRPEYHHTFRSCNRAFHQDPGQRLDHWCGTCDKCCFIDLVLSPYLARTDLETIFGGTEPLENPVNEARFAALLGLGDDARPFECVGDVDECRAALLLAAARADRTSGPQLRRLRDEVARVSGTAPSDATTLLVPRGPHHIPERYAPADLLVRTR